MAMPIQKRHLLEFLYYSVPSLFAASLLATFALFVAGTSVAGPFFKDLYLARFFLPQSAIDGRIAHPSWTGSDPNAHVLIVYATKLCTAMLEPPYVPGAKLTVSDYPIDYSTLKCVTTHVNGFNTTIELPQLEPAAAEELAPVCVPFPAQTVPIMLALALFYALINFAVAYHLTRRDPYKLLYAFFTTYMYGVTFTALSYSFINQYRTAFDCLGDVGVQVDVLTDRAWMLATVPVLGHVLPLVLGAVVLILYQGWSTIESVWARGTGSATTLLEKVPIPMDAMPMHASGAKTRFAEKSPEDVKEKWV